jgi:uncharacterized protein with HEPN domain
MLLDSDSIRIRHMIEAVRQALDYAADRNAADIDADPPVKALLIRNLEILGEAASRITPELRAAHQEVPWRDMVDLRNRLIHAYFDVDMDIIWTTVQRALPGLLVQLEALLPSPDED